MASNSAPAVSGRSHGPELAVVIPTYGRPETIRELLAQLDFQTLAPERFEVVVVDDGTPVPIALDASEHAYSLTLLRQANAGPGAARNLAFEHVRAPLTLILNDDAVPAPDLLEKHLAAHSTCAPKTALLGSFNFTARALRSPFVQLLQASNLLFDFPSLVHGRRLDWQHFWTCNLSLPTQALREVGGFDAVTFREAIAEDVELGYRLSQRGWKVEFRSDLVCEHDHVLNARGFFERMVRLGVNMSKFAGKHARPELLHFPEGCTAGPAAFAKLQHSVESFYPMQVELVAKLERLDRDHAGKHLPADLIAQLCGLVRRVSLVGYWAGILQHHEGASPLETLRDGPRAEGLTSIVMVSYNALDKTRKCIEALRRTADERFVTELIVVDNGSSDGSAQWLAAQSDLRLIQNADNLGAPKARNQALARARGEWIVVMDNDAIVSPGWLERLRFHAQVDARSGCVGPLSDRAAHGQQIPYEGAFDFDSLAKFAGEHGARNHRRGRQQNVLTSFLLLMRREVLDTIGGFDERFSPWGFEDDDFTLRATLAGFRNRCALDVFVRHEHYGGAKAARHNDLLQRNWCEFAGKWAGRPDAKYGDYSVLEPALKRSFERSELFVPLPALPDPAPALPARCQPAKV
jgi:GT2 family glycosyltransferase